MLKFAAAAIVVVALATPSVASAAVKGNPLYTPSGTVAENPLYKGDH
jgi:hypothetical protein